VPSIARFEDIQAWQKARALTREVYDACGYGTLKTDFGLKGQLCRAAVSAMSNVAEGLARKSDRDFARFLDIARGATVEVQSLLYAALDSGSLSREQFERLFGLANETTALIGGFTSYLRRSSSRRQRTE